MKCHSGSVKDDHISLRSLPRASRPLNDVTLFPKERRPATISPKDATPVTDARPHIGHGDCLIAFQCEDGTPTSLDCPLAKLGLCVESCTSPDKKRYSNWRYLVQSKHLVRHIKAGHLTYKQLDSLNDLNRSHGLPAPSTKILAEGAKYVRRAIIIIAWELKQHELLLDPYKGRPLGNNETLGLMYHDFLVAVQKFKKRINGGDQTTVDGGPMASSTIRSPGVVSSLPEVQSICEFIDNSAVL